MRTFLVVLLLVLASAALARETEFEEFRASVATNNDIRALGYERLDPGMFDSVAVTALAERARDFYARGAQTLDPGGYDVPVVAALPSADDAALVRTLEIVGATGTGSVYRRLQCWVTAF